MLKFARLGKVAQVALILLHSNADAERVFSMIGLNKTETRNSLALDGTLSNDNAITSYYCIHNEPFDLMTPKSNRFIGSARYIHDPSLEEIHLLVLEISRERDGRTTRKQCLGLLCSGGIKMTLVSLEQLRYTIICISKN